MEAKIDYVVRLAVAADRSVICDHRRRMFEEIDLPMGAACVDAFDAWLRDALATGLYRGWLVESAEQRIVSGAGLTVVPWPPGPGDDNDRAVFVYNVFTEPAFRRRGLARMLMTTIHDWCHENRIATVRLHASTQGRCVYESLGYSGTNEMMLRL
jgi:GNAT superfamily N-acetyltransferase